jgi:3-oxoacyl-(acyl-carrier-protein) synthase
MAGFLDRAKEQAQRGIAQGKQKIDDVQAQRTGHDLLQKLGSAYYAQQHGTGTPEGTQKALNAVESHVSEHGDAFLDK